MRQAAHVFPSRLPRTCRVAYHPSALLPASLLSSLQAVRQPRHPAGSLDGRTLFPPLPQVIDEPRFPWRGVLLDTSRHFYDLTCIKRVLDMMALYKMNVFHWHLVDDQGWRMEVPALPRLTEVLQLLRKLHSITAATAQAQVNYCSYRARCLYWFRWQLVSIFC